MEKVTICCGVFNVNVSLGGVIPAYSAFFRNPTSSNTASVWACWWKAREISWERKKEGQGVHGPAPSCEPLFAGQTHKGLELARLVSHHVLFWFLTLKGFGDVGWPLPESHLPNGGMSPAVPNINAVHICALQLSPSASWPPLLTLACVQHNCSSMNSWGWINGLWKHRRRSKLPSTENKNSTWTWQTWNILPLGWRAGGKADTLTFGRRPKGS